MVYGIEPVFPAQLKVWTLQFTKDFIETNDVLEARLVQLAQVEEKIEQAFQNLTRQYLQTKRWFDQNTQVKSFRVGDLVLLWDKAHEDKEKHAKFDRLWLGLFEIDALVSLTTFKLRRRRGEELSLLVNGKHLKHYFQA